MEAYDFEEIGEDLPRPPFAALRALQTVGVIVTPKGWQALNQQARAILASEGARDRVDILAVRTVINGIPANQIKLVARAHDPDAERPSDELLKALGPHRAIAAEEWQQLRILDRFTLTSLVYNTRLLWRAVEELQRKGKLTARRAGPWTGALASCELRMRSDVFARLVSPDFMEGRAFVLAKGAGRRAARRASELFDLQAEIEAGPVELDWGATDRPGVMLWQAHVSGWDGAFLPAPSLHAAVSAAVAVYDMIKELDPEACLVRSGVTEDAWSVGNDSPLDMATRLYAKPRKASVPPQQETPRPGGRTPLAPGAGSTLPLGQTPTAPAPAATPLAPPATTPPPPPSSRNVMKLDAAPNRAIDEPVEIPGLRADRRQWAIAAGVLVLLVGGAVAFLATGPR